MRALVVYESMFGNTRLIAERVAFGLGPDADVTLCAVGDVEAHQLAELDLLVVGGPTHVHGMSTSLSRKSAHETADDPKNDLHLDDGAEGEGLRDWLATIEKMPHVAGAAFDTRIDGPAILTGRAAKTIGRRLTSHGLTLLAPPESFLVDKDTALLPGEAGRAERWGRLLASALIPAG